MVRDDIFSVEFPENEKLKSFLKLTKLSEEYSSTRLFEKTAALLAARFPINAKIGNKIKANPNYFITWQKLCTSLFYYLLGPAKFLDRSDAEELVCLPIVTKIIIGNSLQTVRAISVYNSTKRIGTLFFRDPEYNNEFAFFGQNEFVSIGSWVSKVRADVQNYNLYGLTKTESATPTTSTKSSIIESVDAVGNTITVRDVFAKIDSMKNIYKGNY